MKKQILSIACAIFLFSCGGPNENAKLIVGNWTGVEWLENGSPSGHNASAAHFNFDDKGNYSFEYGDNKENGSYKVERDMLFTTPKGEAEIMVKITKLNKDSLVFDMNRGGTPEILTLVRK